MISIFILGYPQSLQGGGLGGSRGGFSPILPKIISYIDSGVFKSGDFKNDLYSHFRVPQTPARAPTGGGLGARGGTPPKFKCHVNSGVSIVGNSKMISIFI